MTTIKVTKHTRKMIESYREDGETVDDAIRRLLKSTKPLEIMDRTGTNISLSEATFKDLMGYKAYPTQSHSDTIMELLKSLE